MKTNVSNPQNLRRYYLSEFSLYDGLAFTYDGYGRRINKGSISYVYDAGGKLIREAKSGEGAYTLEFVYNGNEVIGIKHNSTNYMYRKNAQGDITYIYGIDGTIKACYTYDAWGNHTVTCYDVNGDIIETPSATHIGNLNPFRYRSYYYDTETGLYYLLSRYYDPIVCRFLNADSIDYLEPETLNGLNLYAYCLNNPVMNYDPSLVKLIINITIMLRNVIMKVRKKLKTRYFIGFGLYLFLLAIMILGITIIIYMIVTTSFNAEPLIQNIALIFGICCLTFCITYFLCRYIVYCKDFFAAKHERFEEMIGLIISYKRNFDEGGGQHNNFANVKNCETEQIITLNFDMPTKKETTYRIIYLKYAKLGEIVEIL